MKKVEWKRVSIMHHVLCKKEEEIRNCAPEIHANKKEKKDAWKTGDTGYLKGVGGNWVQNVEGIGEKGLTLLKIYVFG